MANFAQIDAASVVVNIIVAEQDVIDSGVLGDPSQFIEYGPDKPVGLQGAGPGYTYVKEYPAFISPKPYPSWVLNTETYQWEAPVPNPNADGHEKCADGKPVDYYWNESTLSWDRQSCPEEEG